MMTSITPIETPRHLSLELFGNPSLEKECHILEEIVKETLPSFLEGWEICSLAHTNRSWKQLLKREFVDAFRHFEDHDFLEKQIPKNFHNQHTFEVVESLFFENFFKAKPLAQSIHYSNELQGVSLNDFPQVILDLNFLKFCLSNSIPYPQKNPNETLPPYAARLRKWTEHYRIQNATALLLIDSKITVLSEEIHLLTQLETLIVKENRLNFLSDSIQKLERLTYLNLKDNQLFHLSESIGKLARLNFLSASTNRLKSLPESIGNLQNLAQLYLYENQLTSLPDSIGNLRHLTRLDLSSNQLVSLPDSIGNLRSLTYLELSKNQLRSLPDSICTLIQLNTLNLSNNQLCSLPNSFKSLRKTLINISHNPGDFTLHTNCSLL